MPKRGAGSCPAVRLAYYRYLDAKNGKVDSTSHWHDAEREYIADAVLRGQPLSSFVKQKKADSEESSDD